MRRIGCPQAPTHFVAVDARHPEIEQDHVGRERGRSIERRSTVVLAVS
jgi:hypothetical protein